MATLEQVSRNLQPLKSRNEIYRIVLQASSKFEAYLVDLNQIQLSRGLNIFGQPIGVYSEATEEIAATESTREPKIAGQPYNFEWTGDLFDGMTVRFTPEFFEIFSTDSKYDLIITTYSGFFSENSVFGLTQEHLSEFIQQKLLPELRDYIWKAMDLAA